MKRVGSMAVSGQLLVAIIMIFGININVQAAAKRKGFKPTYKVERCDCFGYSDGLETFLSDLDGGRDIDIYGEGKTLEAATKQAHGMCVDHYRGLAGNSNVKSVTESGCEKLRSTPDGDWINI